MSGLVSLDMGFRTKPAAMNSTAKFPSISTETSYDARTETDSYIGSVQAVPPSRWNHFVDSFRPSEVYLAANCEKVSDIESGPKAPTVSPLARRLKGRHLQMIAIGGSIGTGLFVNSGKALSNGGPASLLIAFIIIGFMLYNVVHALGELAAVLPVSGSFATYSTRFIDPAWGFAMGWNYAMQWLVVFPLELVAASITLDYWHIPINNAVWITIFWVAIITINLFGVKGYGEAEFCFSIVKVVAVIGFIIGGAAIVCGASQEGFIGDRYWHNPGPFNQGFKGLASVLVTAAFAFGGTELVGLAAAETANPRKTIPSAVKQVFWRIALFYIVGLTIVGLLVPYDNPNLLGATSDVDLAASPFVIAVKNAGIKGMPSVMNAVILVSVLSVGNSAVYGCSRTMASLAEINQAPKILSYVDRSGRPLVGIALSAAFGLLAFVSASSKQGEIFHWLLALSGLSFVFTWGSICMSHILFRRAWKAQGHSLDELAFKSQPGIIGSWIGVILNALVLCAQCWVAIWPISGMAPNASDFFQAFLTVPVVLTFFTFYKFWRKTKVVKSTEADLVNGRREVDIPALVAELEAEHAEMKRRPWYYRVYKIWC
ncbi:amino acid permease-domain-containing protein [Limtongia smithiae]|uniref:amino acid permease-domain-containing protein n=1 Tax=Limtongia smithiae TaxID=1125753 RepID=UPI0034CD817D